MLNFENELNPEAVASNEGTGVDTTAAAIAAYEAMGDAEMAMIKVDMLEKGAKILSDSMNANDALIAKGFESEGGASPVETGFEAVCVMLGVNADMVAGFESEGDEKAEGLLKKIWEGIKKAAETVWKAIVSLFTKITTLVKGLIGKGDTTDKALEKILEGDVQEPRELTEDEIKSVAGKLAVLSLAGKSIDAVGCNALVDTQTALIEGVAKSDVLGGFVAFEKVLGKLEKAAKEDAIIKAIGEVQQGLLSFTTPVVGVPFKEEMLSKDQQDKLAKEKEAILKEDGGYTLKEGIVNVVGVSKAGITLLIVGKFTKDLDVKVNNKLVTFKPDGKAIEEFIKGAKGSKTLSKSEIEGLAKKYVKVIKVAGDVVGKVDVKKLQKSALGVIETAEKILTTKKDLSDGQLIIVKRTFNTIKSVVNNVYPSVIKAISETAIDVTKSNVVTYAELSVTDKKKEEKKEEK